MAGALTQDQLVAALTRAMSESYIEPMQASGEGGWELVLGIAKVGERCSLAVSRLDDDAYIMSAVGPALATVTVTFHRNTDAGGSGTVKSGSLVRASAGGQVFRTVEDAVFGATDLEKSVTAIAAGYGYEYNVNGHYIDQQGEVWPGEIDTVDLPIMDPPFFDATIEVRNDADATGGRPGTLDQIGDERELRRQVGEPDANYRVRIRQLPDTVTPAAIARQLKNFFRPYPALYWRAVETWQHEYQECWDAPVDVPTTYQNYNSNLFCYDDPSLPSPMQNRWLGEQDYRGAFIVELGRTTPILDYGFAYDDTAATVESDLQVGGGIRAWSAYDVPSTITPPSIAPAYDGYDFGFSDLVVNLMALLDRIKAGGVYVVIALQELS